MYIEGFKIVLLEAGDKIINTLTSKEEVIDDKSWLIANDYLYCTRTAYEKLKLEIIRAQNVK